MPHPLPRGINPGRRGVLLVGVVAIAAGCSRLTDPVVHGTSSASAAPDPSPEPRFVEASAQIQELRAKVRGWADAAPRTWHQAMDAMLAAHCQVVTARRPLSGLPSPAAWITPSAVPSPTHQRAQDFALAADRVADAHLRRCAEAQTADEAMLWASLSVATKLHRSPGPVPRPGPRPRTLTLSGEAEARNALLGHLHALAQLLELGVGDTRDKARTRFEARLAQVRHLVAEQQRRLRHLKVTPTGPLPGYQWPGPVDTPAQITATWPLAEELVLTAHAPVVAVSDRGSRSAVLSQMVTQGRVVQALGRGTTDFPGWV